MLLSDNPVCLCVYFLFTVGFLYLYITLKQQNTKVFTPENINITINYKKSNIINQLTSLNKQRLKEKIKLSVRSINN